MDEMQAAWERDMHDEQRLRELKGLIQDFRANPPGRVSGQTLVALGAAVDAIRTDMDRIVAAWD